MCQCSSLKPGPQGAPRSEYWMGLHVLIQTKQAAEVLERELPGFAAAGINVIIAEVDYNYEFEAHPELRGRDPISKEQVKRLVRLCRKHQVKLIPQFQALGHQSWAKSTFPLLTQYPQFDETPGLYPHNDGIYCRSWCPLHPEVNPIVFQLCDELLEAFEAKALHVGMDEVLLIGENSCPRCKGKNRAELFAKAIKDFHEHLVKKRGVEMLMWGDRLLDSASIGYAGWEAAENGTAPAIDMIPKDIIICDWHYGKRDDYPSIPLFLEKGFRVLPTSWRDAEAAAALVDFSLKFGSDKRMLGHLCTLWRAPKDGESAENPAIRIATQRLKNPQ